MINRLLIRSQQNGVLPLTSRCNFRCVFCSRPQNPPSIRSVDIADRCWDDLCQAIDDMGSLSRIVIGESATMVNEGEPCCHPHWRQALIRIRNRCPSAEVMLTTNARLLKEADSRLLADLDVRVTVSLNFTAERWRRQLLGDDNPQETLTMVERLAESGVALEGSIVALTGITGQDELKSAVTFFDRIGVSLVRVFMPGWTRWGRADVVTGAQRRSELVDMCGEIRSGLRTAVVVEPGEVEDLEARVEEVVPGSVADQIGICRGDVITRINGRRVSSRTEASRLFRGEVYKIELNRQGKGMELEGYKRPADGTVMYRDIGRSTLRRLGRAISRDRSLVVCSLPAYELVSKVLSAMESDARLVSCRSAVLGGNISAAGLLTFSDIARSVRRITGFDRIVVPKVLADLDGKDMQGKTADDLASVVGAQVIMV